MDRPAHRLGHVDLDAEQLHQPPRIARHLRPRHAAKRRAAGAAEHEILGDRQVGEGDRLLVDQRDAELLRDDRSRDLDRLAVEREASPRVGRCTPARILAKVDLPAPFSPSSAWISPRLRSRSTSRSTSIAGELTCEMPRAEISGMSAAAGRPRPCSASRRNRRIGIDQLLRLEVGPEGGRDRRVQRGDVLRHLARPWRRRG